MNKLPLARTGDFDLKKNRIFSINENCKISQSRASDWERERGMVGERRGSPRVAPVDDCIVIHSQLIGNLKNISKEGLHCTCIQDRGCTADAHQQIDILCGEGNFLVQGLKVRIVQMERINGKFLRNMEIKKCRLQFEDIAEEQASGIETIVTGACLQ
jgi:hypothetical protein